MDRTGGLSLLRQNGGLGDKKYTLWRLFYIVMHDISFTLDAHHGKLRENPRRRTWCLRVGNSMNEVLSKLIISCLRGPDLAFVSSWSAGPQKQ